MIVLHSSIKSAEITQHDRIKVYLNEVLSKAERRKKIGKQDEYIFTISISNLLSRTC